jgi:hypothetical protein
MLPPVVHLVCSVCLVCLVFWLNETNQMNQINQINKTNQINQTDWAYPRRAGHQNPAVPNWFFCNLLLVDISKRCAILERRLEVRG